MAVGWRGEVAGCGFRWTGLYLPGMRPRMGVHRRLWQLEIEPARRAPPRLAGGRACGKRRQVGRTGRPHPPAAPRADAFGPPGETIRLPGMKPAGLARKAESVRSSHTIEAESIAGELTYSGACPDLRP